ncbi:hypothetical protein KUCAC02_034414, partial [Chaenocephalus aceratus]
KGMKKGDFRGSTSPPHCWKERPRRRERPMKKDDCKGLHLSPSLLEGKAVKKDDFRGSTSPPHCWKEKA